jgi:AcrR family transcriptional regulator
MLERAGLSFGSLYHYFPGGKDEILLALAERIFREDLTSLLPEQVSSDERAANLLAELLSRLFAPGGTSLLPQLRPRAAHDDAIRKALLRWDRLIVDSMATLTTAAQDEGDLRRDLDPAAVVETVIVFFEGLKTREAARCFATDYEQVASTFLKVLLAGSAIESSKLETLALRKVRRPVKKVPRRKPR